jgi:Tol biopolymer transport system component
MGVSVSVPPGTRLGSYEITSLLGSGGMGEVYRAKDLKLGRDVAIKVLPKQLAADPERLKRFEREARAASALDHPNIVTIHDIAETDGVHFIVMQYVAGKTLRELMAEGRLDLNTTLRYAIQIADGLSRAHQHGLVHRDLKPDNVMVDEDEQVKILDFGKASALTQDGHIVGTAPYMSPEQAQGHRVDARSDVFSVGSVLYEMVTGRRAFSGANTVALLASIVRDEPEKVSTLIPAVPADLEKVVARALRKEPGRRFHSMTDLRVELQEIQEELESGISISAEQVRRAVARPKRRKWVWAASAFVAVGIGAAAWLYIPPPDGTEEYRIRPLTSLTGMESHPALSPDGKQVAFAWNGGGDDPDHIYIKLIGEGDPLQLTNGPLREIGRLEAEVFVIPALGGRERRLGTTLVPSHRSDAQASGLDWSPDGRFLATSDRTSAQDEASVFLISTETGEKRRLTPPHPGTHDVQPAFSPDGKMVAFIRGIPTVQTGHQILLQSVDGGEPTLLTVSEGFITDLDWMPDGSALIFALDLSSLWRLSTSGGKPERLPFGENAFRVSVARTGSRLAYTEISYPDMDVWRIPGPAAKEQGPPTKLIDSTRLDWQQAYSPDGTKIAFISERAGSNNLWMCNSNGKNYAQLTDVPVASNPLWSPDGKSLAFVADTEGDGNGDMYVLDAEGGFPRRLTDGAPTDWSADGRWIYFIRLQKGSMQLWRIRADGEDRRLVADPRGGAGPARLSPDGESLYYVPFQLEMRTGIWRIPLNGGEPTLALQGLHWLTWDFWGRNLIYVNRDDENDHSIELLDLDTRKETRLASVGTVAPVGFSVSPDGRWILFTRTESEEKSDIILVENFR